MRINIQDQGWGSVPSVTFDLRGVLGLGRSLHPRRAGL